MEAILAVVISGVILIGMLYFTTAKKQENVRDTASREICEKCLKNLEELVRRLGEFKKGGITGTEFINAVVKIGRATAELAKEAEEKDLPENIVYALKDASGRLESFKFSDDSWKEDIEKVQKILEEIKEKIGKIDCSKTAVPDDIVRKAYELNRILAGIDVGVIVASLKDTGLTDIAKEIDKATLLSKEIAEGLNGRK